MTAATDDDALACPLCGYDLRGLPSPRCPECGHAFDPAELRRAKRERRELFFEHSIDRRLILAFVRTSLASFYPPRFWRRVHAAHAIVPARLGLWAFLWLVVTFGVVIAITIASNDRAMTGAPVLLLLVAAILWAPATALATNVFGITLRRAGIRSGHLWRCALYAWPTLLTIGFVGLAAIASFDLDVRWMPRNAPLYATLRLLELNRTVGLFTIAMVTVASLHQASATATYLRLRHAIAQALLVQIVVGPPAVSPRSPPIAIG